MPASSGMYFDAGSSSWNSPSSYSIITATLVMGLVIDAMRKITSSVMGRASSMSNNPWLSRRTSLPCRAIADTTPTTWA